MRSPLLREPCSGRRIAATGSHTTRLSSLQSFRCCRSQPCFSATAWTSTAGSPPPLPLLPPPGCCAAAAATELMAVRLACGGSCGLEVLRLSGLPVGLIGNAAVKAHCMAQRQARLWHFTALRKQMLGCGFCDNVGSSRPPRPPHGTSWQLCPTNPARQPRCSLIFTNEEFCTTPGSYSHGATGLPRARRQSNSQGGALEGPRPPAPDPYPLAHLIFCSIEPC